MVGCDVEWYDKILLSFKFYLTKSFIVCIIPCVFTVWGVGTKMLGCPVGFRYLSGGLN